MHCTICNLPTGNIVGSTLPQCKCGWQKPNPPVTQRTWVDLTDEEVNTLWDEWKDAVCLDHKTWAQAIRAKLKDKNL